MKPVRLDEQVLVILRYVYNQIMEAMSSTQNVSIADERATAQMRVVVPKGHDLVGAGNEQTVFVVDADAHHPRP